MIAVNLLLCRHEDQITRIQKPVDGKSNLKSDSHSGSQKSTLKCRELRSQRVSASTAEF